MPNVTEMIAAAASAHRWIGSRVKIESSMFGAAPGSSGVNGTHPSERTSATCPPPPLRVLHSAPAASGQPQAREVRFDEEHGTRTSTCQRRNERSVGERFNARET